MVAISSPVTQTFNSSSFFDELENTTFANTSATYTTDDVYDEYIYLDYDADFYILLVGPSVLLPIGTFGNICAILVMSRFIKRNESSQELYFICLAISDLFLLYLTLSRHFIVNIFSFDYRDLNGYICKVFVWLTYSANLDSAWILTAVTIQRTIAVKWPHKVQIWFTARRNAISLAIVASTPLMLNSHILYGFDVRSEGYCGDSPPGYRVFAADVFPWLDMFLSSILPSLILIVCNVVLSLSLRTATQSLDSTNVENRRKAAARTTVVIMAMSLTFLILTLPICIFFIWDRFTLDWGDDDDLILKKAVIQSIVVMLSMVNNCINFFLYCLTGRRFRNEFLSLISCNHLCFSPTVRKERIDT